MSPAVRALEGAGIHTGAPGRVEFSRRSPEARAAKAGSAREESGRDETAQDRTAREGSTEAPVAHGVRFHLGDRVYLPRDLAGLPRAARRATVIGEGAQGLHTPEHLLAALLFFADLDIDVRIQGSEVPNLDGSAQPFRDALADLCPERAAAPVWREAPCRLTWEHAWPDGHIRIEPAERFSVTFAIERPGLSERVRIASPVEAWEAILPARTWILRGDWAAGRAAGLLQGADEESGLLLAGTREEHRGARTLRAEWPSGPYPLINRPGWRMDGEPVRHKVLDLLGDLALLDLSLPSAEIEIRNGGHHVNHLLLERLIHG